MKYRIRFYADFASSEKLKEMFEDVYETNKMENYGMDKDIYITTGDDYTHVILINNATPQLKAGMNKKNVVGLAYEPTIFVLLHMNMNHHIRHYFINTVGKYFIGDTVLCSPFMEHYAYMLHNKALNYIPEKQNECPL